MIKDDQTHSEDLQRVAAGMKSYTGAAVLVFFLYFLFFLPGFIANLVYWRDARRMEQIAGEKLPGARALSTMMGIAVAAIIIVPLGVGGFFVYTAVSTINRVEAGLVEPLGELVRQLVIPVTPVILPDPTTILLQVEDEARLITVSADFEKIIRAESNQAVLWGAMGETMLFVARGTVVAGIDLAQLTAEDLQVVDPNTVQIHLPDAHIFDDLPILDNDNSYVVDRDTGLLTDLFNRDDPNLETMVRQAAEDEILLAAQESDLLERAKFNSEQEMRKILQGLGFENVIFLDEQPEPLPPFVQEIPKGYVLTPEAPTEP